MGWVIAGGVGLARSSEGAEHNPDTAARDFSGGLFEYPDCLLLVFAQMVHVQIPGDLQSTGPSAPRSSWVSAAKALTSRKQLAVLGKILTTRVRRLISWFSRSSMLVLFRCLWCRIGSR